MNDYVVSFKRSRMLTLIVFSLIFTVLGVVFIVAFTSQGIGSEKIWLPVIGALIAIFFGLCLLYYINVLIKGKPALKVTEE